MKLLVPLVLAVLAASPRPAEASCGSPRWIGTPSGTTLPSRGSLYVHFEIIDLILERPEVFGALEPPSAVWTGSASAWSATAVSATVMRVDYDATFATSAVVESDHLYELDAGWRAPEQAPSVIQYWHYQHSWTCSWADSVMIQIDQPTAAFEVSWTFGGVTRTFIEAAQDEALELGKIDCGDASISPAELAAGGELSLTAIRFDGSRVAVAGMPIHIKFGEMPTKPDPFPGFRTVFPMVPLGASLPIRMLVLGLLALAFVVARRWRIRATEPVA